MRTHLKRHLSQMSEGADEGFTLIELLVVLLILGILLAIAIPTFLTVTKSATNTAVTSNLQTALTGSETFYTQNAGNYGQSQSTSNLLTGTAAASSIAQQGTGLSYPASTATANGSLVSAGSKSISVDILNGGTALALAAWNGSTRCYAIVALKGQTAITGANAAGALGGGTAATSGTWYGYYTVSSQTCSAAAAITNVTNWSSTNGFPS